MAKSKPKQDRMTEDEVQVVTAKPFYQVGVPYQWVMSFGWVVVGFYVGPGPTPLEIRVAHASYYRSAGNQTHASLANNGGNDQTSWEYFGDRMLIVTQIHNFGPYHGEVRRGRLAL